MRIDKRTKHFAEMLNLEKKMERYADQSVYVTLKDHKEKFKTKLPCRLINPAKSEIGIVSKVELQKINKLLANQIKFNQWRNTQTVTDWFKLIPNKKKARFIKFDLVEFYPSITEKLLDSALFYAKTLIKQHNSSIMKTEINTNKRDCNYRNKNSCPLDGKCLVECIVYEATVSTTNQTNTYFGLAEGSFKSRYNNHTKSFRLRRYEHNTELSKHIWSLKDSNNEFHLKWCIKTKATPYKCGSRICNFQI